MIASDVICGALGPSPYGVNTLHTVGLPGSRAVIYFLHVALSHLVELTTNLSGFYWLQAQAVLALCATLAVTRAGAGYLGGYSDGYSALSPAALNYAAAPLPLPLAHGGYPEPGAYHGAPGPAYAAPLAAPSYHGADYYVSLDNLLPSRSRCC